MRSLRLSDLSIASAALVLISRKGGKIPFPVDLSLEVGELVRYWPQLANKYVGLQLLAMDKQWEMVRLPNLERQQRHRDLSNKRVVFKKVEVGDLVLVQQKVQSDPKMSCAEKCI